MVRKFRLSLSVVYAQESFQHLGLFWHVYLPIYETVEYVAVLVLTSKACPYFRQFGTPLRDLPTPVKVFGRTDLALWITFI